jgi:hypothetical protein
MVSSDTKSLDAAARKSNFLLGLLVGMVCGGGAGLILGFQLQPEPRDPKAVLENRDEEGSIRGKITYNGQPIPYAVVSATGSNNVMAGADSNEAGEFTIAAPPKGNMRFKIYVPGNAIPALKLNPKFAQGAPVEAQFNYQGGNQTFDIDLK